MSIKYKAQGGQVNAVDVTRETPHFYFLAPSVGWPHGQRVKREGYRETWEEAHTELMERAQRRLDYARRELQAAQGHFGNVKGMRNPAGLCGAPTAAMKALAASAVDEAAITSKTILGKFGAAGKK